MDSKPTYQELEVQIEKLKGYNENNLLNSSIQNGDVYHSLIDNMSEGFAHCQMIYENNTPVDFIYLEVNQTFEKLTGLKNVVGKRISEVIVNHRTENPKLFNKNIIAATINPITITPSIILCADLFIVFLLFLQEAKYLLGV